MILWMLYAAGATWTMLWIVHMWNADRKGVRSKSEARTGTYSSPEQAASQVSLVVATMIWTAAWPVYWTIGAIGAVVRYCKDDKGDQ